MRCSGVTRTDGCDEVFGRDLGGWLLGVGQRCAQQGGGPFAAGVADTAPRSRALAPGCCSGCTGRLVGLSDSVCGAGDYSVRARPLSRWHTANAEMVGRAYERALYMLGGS